MELGLDGSTGVQVVAPALPGISMPPPEPPGVLVVPVQGPRGHLGDPSDPGVVQTAINNSINLHVIDPEPHPAYDDMPTLRLIFENGLI